MNDISSKVEDIIFVIMGQTQEGDTLQEDIVEEAAQALESYINNKVKEARIDELEKLLLESEVVRTDGIVQSYGLFNAVISERLAELKSTSKEK